MSLLIKYLWQAYSGRKFWKKLQKKYDCVKEFTKYIIFPSKDDEYNAWALYFLNSWAKIFKLEKIFVVTTDENIRSSVRTFSEHDFKTIVVSEKQMTHLIRLAGLKNMMDFWTIISVKEPYDTGAERMLGKKGITKKEIVWYDMLQIRELLSEENIVRSDTSGLSEKYKEILEIK